MAESIFDKAIRAYRELIREPLMAGEEKLFSKLGPKPTSQTSGVPGFDPYGGIISSIAGVSQALRNRESISRQQEQMNQLLSMLSGPGPGVDTATLMSQVRGELDPIYDARRQAMLDAISRTESRVGEGREEIESMYEALGTDYERLAPEAAAQAAEAQSDIESLFGQLRTNIEGNYARVSQEQEELFKRLGIEAAAPDVLNPQSEQAVSAMNRADELGTINQQRMADIGDIDESYFRQGAPLARLQGSNLSADLLSQLEDFVAGQESNINLLEAERSSGIQSTYNQLLRQAQSQQTQAESQQRDMLFRLLMGQMEAGAGAEQQELTPETFYNQLGPQRQQRVSEVIRQIERSEPIRTNQIQGRVPGTFVSTPDLYWLEVLDQMLEQGVINPQEYNDVAFYLRLYHDLPQIGYQTGR